MENDSSSGVQKDSCWWNFKNRPAVPADWIERNKIKGILGNSLGLSGLEDRAVGCILGVMIGDILGTPTEGYDRRNIMSAVDPEGKRYKNFVPGKHMGLYHLPVRYGMYTDDTNSTLALASSLTSCGYLNPEHAATNYGTFWQMLPERGYPESAKQVMRSVLQGVDIKKIGTMGFKEGSFANGGVMRISPIGLAFRNATEDELYEAVRMAILSSHVHPEAIDAAFLQAYSISWFLKIKCTDITPLEYLGKLEKISKTTEIKRKINLIIKFLNMKYSGNEVSEEEIWDKLGSDFQIRASEAFPCALWSFVTHWNKKQKNNNNSINNTNDNSNNNSMNNNNSNNNNSINNNNNSNNNNSMNNNNNSNNTEKNQDEATSEINDYQENDQENDQENNQENDQENCLIYVIEGGGDTDTVCSITAALCGALFGTSWIPRRWFENCENGERGRDYAIELAKKLIKLDLHDVEH